jgi:teichoic acid transport system ATP-binding protein
MGASDTTSFPVDIAMVVDHLDVIYNVVGVRAPVGPGDRLATSGQGHFRRAIMGRGGTVQAGVTRVRALTDVSAVFRRGESVGLIGVNGAGKSSLLRAIAGLVPAASGAVYAAADPSFLGVNAALMSDLTGEENIVIGGLAHGLTLREARDSVEEIADIAGVGDFIFLPLKTYSSGMGSRLRFAISTMGHPRILLLDEALSFGDIDMQERSRHKLEAIVEQAGLVIMATHSMEAVKKSCTRCLWLDEGRLVGDGDPEEVCAAYTDYLRLRREAQREARKARSATTPPSPPKGA